jgi:uracil-DNA glycosylase
VDKAISNKLILRDLLGQVRSCRFCKKNLPHEPRPVVRLAETASLLIIGQAPGSKVHASGIPWDDASGDRLRGWLGLSPEQFYDQTKVAIIPMGLCYPGRGKSGDLPPRPECAPLWHSKLLNHLPAIELTLLVGRYAQDYYLEKLPGSRPTILDRMLQTDWRTDGHLPLVHPSPRNRRWLLNNPQFEGRMVPILKRRINQLISAVE